MASSQRFEDIEAWQLGREITNQIYTCSNQRPFAHDFALKNQIRRASISITSNIAEGFERGGNKEFLQFLSNSKGSCGEVRSQIYVALDQLYLSPKDFDELYEKTTRASRMISGLMTYLQASELRGPKYKNP
jgi:four helix bundle protein